MASLSRCAAFSAIRASISGVVLGSGAGWVEATGTRGKRAPHRVSKTRTQVLECFIVKWLGDVVLQRLDERKVIFICVAFV